MLVRRFLIRAKLCSYVPLRVIAAIILQANFRVAQKQRHEERSSSFNGRIGATGQLGLPAQVHLQVGQEKGGPVHIVEGVIRIRA